jgi:hypothetical protein
METFGLALWHAQETVTQREDEYEERQNEP